MSNVPQEEWRKQKASKEGLKQGVSNAMTEFMDDEAINAMREEEDATPQHTQPSASASAKQADAADTRPEPSVPPASSVPATHEDDGAAGNEEKRPPPGFEHASSDLRAMLGIPGQVLRWLLTHLSSALCLQCMLWPWLRCRQGYRSFLQHGPMHLCGGNADAG